MLSVAQPSPRESAERTAGEVRLRALRRAGVAAAAMLLSVNIWTGAPLLAIWVGSRVVPQSGLSMGAVFVVVAVLVVTVLALVAALGRLSARYDELSGRPSAPGRRVAPWLRSMRAERVEYATARAGLGAIERILAFSVVAAVLALEVWFFFFAGSSLPNA
jgi:hypothetical protein